MYRFIILSSAIIAFFNLSTDTSFAQTNPRTTWMKGALGLNWKPARFFGGATEMEDDWMSIEPFLKQVDQLDKTDYIQLHLNESNIFSHSHAAPHARIESMMGDQIIVPRAKSGKDPFGSWLKACKNRGLKTMVYVHSGGLVHGNEEVAKRWKAYCDNDKDVKKFIASKPYHTDKKFPDRQYMFAYGEFVLKEYSQRYGTLIDSWCFDKAKLVVASGDVLSAKPKIETQRLFENWADACRAGNPKAAVAFNHGVGNAKNPLNLVTLVADFTFGHPFGGIKDMAGTPSLYKRNFSICERMKATDGWVFSKDKFDWNDNVQGHYDPKISTSKWNGGKKAGLTNEQFLEWNQVGLSGGAITWGVPLVHSDCNKKHKRPNLIAKDWAFEQLKYMNDRLAVSSSE